MTLLETDAPIRLSIAMRDGSRPQHEAAETSTFIEDLMAGHINPAGYVNYLTCLREVYAALEETGRALADDPIAGQLVDGRLERLESIDADLAHWSTGAPEESLVSGRNAAAYAAAIRSALDSPERYVAHHYTRYLGDLSGGQAIGRVLDRHFDLDGKGLTLYHFEQIEKVKPYKDRYRETLDALPLSAEQCAEVVTEVQRAFTFNQAIFADLAEHLEAFRR